MKIILCTAIDRPTPYIGEFVEYYRGLGVEKFYFTIIHQEPETLVQDIVDVCPDATINKIKGYIESSTTQPYGNLATMIYGPETWCLVPDMDEFGDRDQLRIAMQEDGDYVVGEFVDRIAESHTLEEYDPAQGLFRQYPLNCDITKRATNNNHKMVIAVRGGTSVQLRGSFSFKRQHPILTPCQTEIVSYHFKWRGGVREAMKERIDNRKCEVGGAIAPETYFDNGKLKTDMVTIIDMENEK